MKMENLMIVNTQTGEKEEILGKIMYYSLPKLMVKVDKVKEICESIGFPISVNENISLTDAFKTATSSIYDRIVEGTDGDETTYRIYCRENKRTNKDVVSRELVEETLHETTNSYHKLANISLDKIGGELELSDVDLLSDRNIRGYFNEAENLFWRYQNCVGNRSIETMADKYIASMKAINISGRGHHYFVPRQYMHKIDLLEEFMEELAKENLFTYVDGRDAKYISINSMYVVDDEKQRSKMARDFYQDIGHEIEEYRKCIARLLQSGNTSPRILDRWKIKIQMLLAKKQEYERILKQDLSGVDESFTLLQDTCDQFETQVKRTQVFGIAA